MQRLPDELLRSHAHLSSLEQELGKQRDSLIREYQRGGATSTQQLYGSYYPMLEHFNHLQQQYAAELTKFKTGLKQAVDQNQPQQAQTDQSGVNNIGQVQQVSSQQTQQQTIVNNPNNNITNNSNSRKIAPNGNNYINNGINGINDDAKQPDVNVNNSSQTVQQQASTENEMKVSVGVDALYQGQTGQAPRGRKPPLGSTNSNSNTASVTIPVQPEQPPPPQTIDRGQMNASQIVQSPSSQQPQQITPQRLAPHTRKPKKIVVNRHKYKYEGRGFDIWTRNLKRPIYTSTTIKINDSFRKNEKAVRQFMAQKGGLKEQLIENITFIDPKQNANQRGGRRGGRNQNADNRSMKTFTIVRVRCSLTKIRDCVDRVKALEEYKDNPDFIRKQNNRTRIDNRNNQTSNKLYVNNFDILDKNTHWELTKMFLKFGELEQDIFIGRDKRQNPYAFVVYRTREAAKRCIQQHNRYETTLFYPPKEKRNDQYPNESPRQSVYINRKLHIEYNISNDNNNNTGNRGQGGRGRRGGRGGGRGRGRR